MRPFILTLFVSLFFFSVRTSEGQDYQTATSLQIEIIGLEEISGKVALAVMNEKGETIHERWIFVEEINLSVDIPNLSPGRYAAKFFHDADNSGNMNKNFLGIPTEMFGFSNDAKVFMGPPALEDMLFWVEGETKHAIKARKL